MKPQDVVNAINVLLEGRWLLVSKTARHSRKILEKKPPQNRELEVDKETPQTPLSYIESARQAKQLQQRLEEGIGQP
jgi:hypothetical protein